ncbi:MAG: aldose 1-epimerase [Bryobacteraceae bacterium]|nr:aldose 1-epimerase [Bryobacteraceae bacterium]
MNRFACRVHERPIERGYHAVVLENEWLSATILPAKGAEIYRLEYKPKAMDVLWKSPWGLKPLGAGIPTAATSEEAWLEHYAGGWQEMFPNGGDSCVYKGCRLNFHGEVSTLPWEFTHAEGGDYAEAEFTVATFRSPFRLRRRMRVESGRPVLRIFETLTNAGEEPMRFMWGHHPAFGAPFLSGDCRIQLPECRFEAHDAEIAPTCRLPAGAAGWWPRIPGKEGMVDLSVVPPITERRCEYGYIRDLAEGWYAVTSREHDFSFGLAWPVAVFPYLWFWQELRGSFGFPWYGACYVMAIEPFTSIPGAGLENAIKAGTAPEIQAGGTIEVELAAVYIPGQETVRSIRNDGTVRVERAGG